MVAAASLAAVLAGACTGGAVPPSLPSFPPPGSPGRAFEITFVGPVSAGSSRLDGARLAVRILERDLGIGKVALHLIDDLGDANKAIDSIRTAVGRSDAVLYEGPGSVLTKLRPELERAKVPVLLMGGDLYSTRELFHEVFQVSVPLLWQARELAHYLRVRGEHRVTLVLGGDDIDAARAAWGSASAEEEVSAASETVATEGGAPAVPAGRPVVVLGPPALAQTVAATAPATRRTQVLASADGLVAVPSPGPPLPAGTIATGEYTWSGWARPIPRVGRFRRDFRAAFGRLPLGHEQEGYDALIVAVQAIQRAPRPGSALLKELEATDVLLSSLPIQLGPDDHTFANELQLGVFAVPGPDEASESWLSAEAPWRPVMRSFTSDDVKIVILEEDRGPFFPSWRKPHPSPRYAHAKLGIATGPEDPLH